VAPFFIEAAQGMQLNRATETNPRLSARIDATVVTDRLANHRRRFQHETKRGSLQPGF
jgi:hypothetical protein